MHAVDGKGNIYVDRYTDDFYLDDDIGWVKIWNGALKALKIIVDGKRSMTIPIKERDKVCGTTWNHQIIKFSPHFDSILGSIYVFDSTLGCSIEGGGPALTQNMEFDQEDRLYYFLNSPALLERERLPLSHSDGLYVTQEDDRSYLIRYTPDLHATDLFTLKRNGEAFVDNIWIRGVRIDTAQNLILLACSFAYRYGDMNVSYNGDTLKLPNPSCFWMLLDMQDFHFRSYGMMRGGGYWAELGTSNMG